MTDITSVDLTVVGGGPAYAGVAKRAVANGTDIDLTAYDFRKVDTDSMSGVWLFEDADVGAPGVQVLTDSLQNPDYDLVARGQNLTTDQYVVGGGPFGGNTWVVDDANPTEAGLRIENPPGLWPIGTMPATTFMVYFRWHTPAVGQDSGSAGIFSFQRVGISNMFELSLDRGDSTIITGSYHDAADATVSLPTIAVDPLDDGEWHTIAMTYNGTNTIQVYVDGVRRVEVADTLWTNVGVQPTGLIVIGNTRWNSSGSFNSANIDVGGVFYADAVLTGQQIWDLQTDPLIHKSYADLNYPMQGGEIGPWTPQNDPFAKYWIDPADPDYRTMRNDGGTLRYVRVVDKIGRLLFSEYNNARQPSQVLTTNGIEVFENDQLGQMSSEFDVLTEQPTAFVALALPDLPPSNGLKYKFSWHENDSILQEFKNTNSGTGVGTFAQWAQDGIDTRATPARLGGVPYITTFRFPDNITAPSYSLIRVGGLDSAMTTNQTGDNDGTGKLYLFNRSNNNDPWRGRLSDFCWSANVFTTITQYEGFFAWKHLDAVGLLDPSHPYYSAAPQFDTSLHHIGSAPQRDLVVAGGSPVFTPASDGPHATLPSYWTFGSNSDQLITNFYGAYGQSPWTLQFFVRTTDDNKAILSWGQDAISSNAIEVSIYSGRIRLALGVNTMLTFDQAANNVNDGNWHAVTVRSTGGSVVIRDSIRLFVDDSGPLTRSSENNGGRILNLLTGNPFTIGKRIWNISGAWQEDSFSGDICGVRLITKAMTEDGIQAYHNGSTDLWEDDDPGDILSACAISWDAGRTDYDEDCSGDLAILSQYGRFINVTAAPGGTGRTPLVTGANRAYSSRQEFEAAEETASFNDNMLVECAGGADTTSTSITGWAGTGTLTFLGDQDWSSSCIIDTTKYHSFPGDVSYGLQVNSPIDVIEQNVGYLYDVGNTRNAARCSNSSGSYTAYRCVFQGVNVTAPIATGAEAIDSSSGGVVSAINCWFNQCGAALEANNSAGCRVICCTITLCTRGTNRVETLWGTLYQTVSDDIVGGAGTLSAGYNITSDNEALPGTGSLTDTIVDLSRGAFVPSAFTGTLGIVPTDINTPIDDISELLRDVFPTLTGSSISVVEPAMSIIAQPLDQLALDPGGAVTFGVGLSGTPPYVYQWEVNTAGNWNIISGASDLVYTIAVPTLSMDGDQYRVRVQDANGDFRMSDVATLSVIANPGGGGTGTSWGSRVGLNYAPSVAFDYDDPSVVGTGPGYVVLSLVGNGLGVNGQVNNAISVSSNGVADDSTGTTTDGYSTAPSFSGIASPGSIVLPSSAAIDSGGPYTGKGCSIWFLLENSSEQRQMIFCQGDATSGIALYAYNDDLYLSTWVGPIVDWCVVSTAIIAGEWYAVAFNISYTLSTMTAYVNGKLAMTRPLHFSLLPTAAGGAAIANTLDGIRMHDLVGEFGTTPLYGRTDNFWYFNGIMTERQIFTLHAMGARP